MRAAKNKYVVIQWIDGRWKPITKKRENFREHLEEFNDLNDTAHLHEPPHYYKSIHVCWLDDLKYWEGPHDEAPLQLNTQLDPKDAREVRKFQKYLAARQKYGEAVLLKRKFWRKYLGLEG